ncbi:hypothetical protein [Nocardiopsis coralliicola]
MEWNAFEPARHEPERVRDVLRSEQLAELTHGLSDADRFRVVNNAFTTLLAEPIYWRVFASTVEELFPSDPRVRLDQRVDLTVPGADSPFDPKRNPGPHRSDQTRYMQHLVGMFDSAFFEIYQPSSGPHLENPKHPYYPIRAAQMEFRRAMGAGEGQSLFTDMQRFGRQQFLNMLFAAERVMGAWGAMTAQEAERDPAARLPTSVGDFASALLHNFPLVLQTTRMSPVPVDSIVLGVVTWQPGALELIRDTYGEPAVERFLKEYRQRQGQDFAADLSHVRRWDTAAGTTLPDVGLRLLPTSEDKRAGRAPSGFATGGKGRCPAPETAAVPAALSKLGPPGSPDWARHALRKIETLRATGFLPDRGAPRAKGRTSIAELLWIPCAVHLDKLVAGRTTAAGTTIAPGPPWGSVVGISAADTPRHTTRPGSRAPSPRTATGPRPKPGATLFRPAAHRR